MPAVFFKAHILTVADEILFGSTSPGSSLNMALLLPACERRACTGARSGLVTC